MCEMQQYWFESLFEPLNRLIEFRTSFIWTNLDFVAPIFTHFSGCKHNLPLYITGMIFTDTIHRLN